MATQTIDATLFASSHPDIAKRTSVSGLIISLVMMVAGILIFVSIFEMNDKSSTISMGLMVLGTALILLGVFRLFWKSKEIVYLPTGSVAKERSMFFDLKYIGKLTEMIENGNLDSEAGVKSESSGNVRMYNPQIQISAESETKRSIFREKDKTKRSKKESAQHSKSRNKSFVMTSVSAL